MNAASIPRVISNLRAISELIRLRSERMSEIMLGETLQASASFFWLILRCFSSSEIRPVAGLVNGIFILSWCDECDECDDVLGRSS